MTDKKLEFHPSTKERPRPEEPAEIVTHDQFKERSAKLEEQRRSENPLNISEIFELINTGDVTKEKLDDFELEPDLKRALRWVVDLLQKTKRLEKATGDQKAAIEQFEALVKERDATIEHLKRIIAKMEDNLPPLGGA